MSSAWAQAKACEFLFGDNFPSGAEVHVERLAVLLDAVRAEDRARIVAWLRDTGRYSNLWNLDEVADLLERFDKEVGL